MFCAQQVAEFRPHLDELTQRGIDLAVIGSGAPQFALGFQERMGLPIPIYSDQALASYRAARMNRSLWRMFHPGQLLGWRALRHFRLQLLGDATQQGGVVIVTPGGRVIYEFHNRFAGDHPRPAAVVRAALAAGPR
jgi:peroxiredoxin